MNNKFLILIAADYSHTHNALNAFINSIIQNYPAYNDEWNFFVLTPDGFDNRLMKRYNRNKDINFIKIKSQKFQNIYLYKTILIDFVVNKCSDNNVILYLDYDHICYSKFILPKINNNTIYLSSEEHTLEYSKVNGLTLSQFVNFKNGSLIFSEAASFIRATSKWFDYIKKLEKVIAPKHLDEVAFLNSSIDGNVILRAIPSEVQSNWSNLTKAPLFHYGGDTYLANQLKKILIYTNSGVERNKILIRTKFKSTTEKSFFTKIINYF